MAAPIRRRAPLKAFSQRGLKGVKARSYGRLEWKTAPIPGSSAIAPGSSCLSGRCRCPAAEWRSSKGTISPLLVRQGALRAQTLMRFPPRFRTREVELAARLGVGEVLEGRIVARLQGRVAVAEGDGAGNPRERRARRALSLSLARAARR